MPAHINEQQSRMLVRLLNASVAVAIVVVCAVFQAGVKEFACFLIAWSSVVTCTRIFTGTLPTFGTGLGSVALELAFVVWAFFSTWTALDQLVMGRLPVAVTVPVYAYTALPEIVRYYCSLRPDDSQSQEDSPDNQVIIRPRR